MACDVEQIVEDSACVFCMIPTGLQPYALLAIFCAIRDGNTDMSCDPQAIIDEAKCLQCKIPDGLVFSALVAVACGIAQGGSSSAQQVFCGHYAGGTPTDVPTTACALAYDLDAPFALWHYESGVWA